MSLRALFLFALPAFFAISSAPLFGDVQFTPSFSKKTSRKFRRELELVIEQMNARLGHAFELPSLVVIDESKPDFGASATFQFQDRPKTISLPFPYVFYDLETSKRYKKNPSFLKPVLAHEYGHLIFDLELERVAKDLQLDELLRLYRAYKEIMGPIAEEQKALSDQKSSLLKALEKLKTSRKNPSDLEAARSRITNAIEEIEAQLNKLSAKSEALSGGLDLQDLFSPSHEIFSDLVTTAHWGDGKIIAKSISFAGWKYNPRSFFYTPPPSARDMTRDPHIKGLVPENHIVLEETARYIWRELLSRPELKQRKPQTLKSIAEILCLDLHKRILDEKLRSADSDDPKQMNARLIEAIKSTFAGQFACDQSHLEKILTNASNNAR